MARTIDETRFATAAQLQQWCDTIGEAGFRGTGSAAHEGVIAWVERELAAISGITVRADEFELLGWHPVDGDLEHSGTLLAGGESLPVAGAVPYTKPTTVEAPLVYVPAGEDITADNAAGRVVLRDFPQLAIPYDLLFGIGLHVTPGCDSLRGQTWDRPGLADPIIDADLRLAGELGAVAMIVAFDLPREQVAGYFDPHKGTHYRVPGLYVGFDERETLRALADDGGSVSISVRADVGPASTRNVIATLPGQSAERIVLCTHTDGNTWVQENGIAALLALAHYFAALPIEQRQRTIEFAFTSAHLHISREGAFRYAAQLDDQYDDGTIAFAFALEHMGARELNPVARTDGPGRRLEFAAGTDPLLWAAGPSDALRGAVIDAVAGRGLERVVVAAGFGATDETRVPRILQFGGLGTAFNMHLIPTTSIITGPWSLWAPSFGCDAIDVAHYRQQALAAGDVIVTLDGVPRDEIAGGYLADRAARAAGTPNHLDYEPPEIA